jgi:hypothetical protein
VFTQGGDRMTLAPSNFVVSFCDISFFNRWVFTYAPGIFINGVGQQVENNVVHDGPHMVWILSFSIPSPPFTYLRLFLPPAPLFSLFSEVIKREYF